MVCITFFTIEYCSRFLLAPRHYGLEEDPEDAIETYSEPFCSVIIKSRLRFTFSFLNAIDLIAILPFYIELLLGGEGGALSFVRIIRLARVFRLFKLGKYSEGLQMLGKTMTESFSSLAMICSMLAIYLILISTLMHYLERGTFCSAENDFCNGTADGMGWFAAPHEYFGSFFEHGTCSSPNWCRDESFFQNIFISNCEPLCPTRVVNPCNLDLFRSMHLAGWIFSANEKLHSASPKSWPARVFESSVS